MGETRCACALEGRIQKKTNWKVDNNVEEKDTELKPWVEWERTQGGSQDWFLGEHGWLVWGDWREG